jgi:hypothetical protein
MVMEKPSPKTEQAQPGHDDRVPDRSFGGHLNEEASEDERTNELIDVPSEADVRDPLGESEGGKEEHQAGEPVDPGAPDKPPA